MRGASEWGQQHPCLSGTLLDAAAGEEPQSAAVLQMGFSFWGSLNSQLSHSAVAGQVGTWKSCQSQLLSILPGCQSTGPKHPGERASPGMPTACQAGSKEQTIPASLVVHLASCGAVWQSRLCSNLCGKLLRTQRTWKPWVPICRPGKRWAAEEPRLPVPVGWSWEAGKPSCRSLQGVSASLAGAGEPQTLPEPHSYFGKST